MELYIIEMQCLETLSQNIAAILLCVVDGTLFSTVKI